MRSNNNILMMNGLPVDINILNSIQLYQQQYKQHSISGNNSTFPSIEVLSLISQLASSVSSSVPFLPPLPTVNNYSFQNLQQLTLAAAAALVADAGVHGTINLPVVNTSNSLLNSRVKPDAIPHIFASETMLPSTNVSFAANQMGNILPLMFENNGGINNYAVNSAKNSSNQYFIDFIPVLRAKNAESDSVHQKMQQQQAYYTGSGNNRKINRIRSGNLTSEWDEMLLRTLHSNGNTCTTHDNNNNNVLLNTPASTNIPSAAFPLPGERKIKMEIFKIGEEMAAAIAEVNMDIKADQKLMERQMQECNMSYMNIKCEKNVTKEEIIEVGAVVDMRTAKFQPVIHQKKWICNCGKIFKHRTNLKIHAIVHTEKAHKCRYCTKKFARKSNLRQHERVHTDERPFCCTHCNAGFKQPHSLKDHIRIHTGERPFHCEFCTKSFKVKHNMVVHRRLHTGERPFGCRLCSRKFASKSSLNGHTKKSHPGLWKEQQRIKLESLPKKFFIKHN